MKPALPPHPELDELLHELVEERVPPMDPAAAQRMRAQVVGRIAALQAGTAQRRAGVRPWRRVLLLAAASLPLAVIAFAVLRHRMVVPPADDAAAEVTAMAGDPEIAREGEDHPLVRATSTPFSDADELRTGPGGAARAALPTGAVVDVGPQARLRFHAVRERSRGAVRDRVELLGGKIDVQVPKLGPGSEVSVRSDDLTVVVHGTKFSVERLVTGPWAGQTRVKVQEGRVAVYFGGEERLLTSGATLTVPPSVPSGPDGSTARVPPEEGPESERPENEEEPGPASSSTLAAENDLLGGALRLRTAGDPRGALAKLEDLLARYPASPLVETARVEKLRALEDLGATARARRDAEQYLRDYPRGYARKEAARVLALPRKPTP